LKGFGIGTLDIGDWHWRWALEVRWNQVIYSKKLYDGDPLRVVKIWDGKADGMGVCAQEVSAFQRQEREISSKNILKESREVPHSAAEHLVSKLL
jgi:hypothetical protein